jgi:ssDNA-binding Zn-finger/Zn-ribbon topoisomerase 1
MSPFSYICVDCGHTWNPRSENPKRSQCSKCKSRNVSKVDHVTRRGKASPDEAECALKPHSSKANGKLSSIPMILADDPDVKDKLKELELVRIEKQIAEAKGELAHSRAFDRHVSNFKSLLVNLFDNGYISELAFTTFSSECPWCGESEMVFEETRTDISVWKCRKCGKVVI